MKSIASAVVAHFGAVRRDLPWRRARDLPSAPASGGAARSGEAGPCDPYAIWVSEIMLQQTRVQTVIPYWEKWMARFPTVTALADAPLDDVLAAWAGLGYYTRARNLHAGARVVVDAHAGALPRRASELRGVPGIGAYTAGAIASIAYGERAPLVDGNVARVLARVFDLRDDIKSTAGQKALWRLAGELMAALPATAAPGDLNQGLMELGATLCSPTSPRCLACPLATHCAAARDGTQDVLPVVAKRKGIAELPILAREHVWIEDGGELLLARRAPEGLFGGLWELPTRELAIAAGSIVDPTPVAHHDQVLSHRRLRVTVVRGTMPAALVEPPDPGYDRFARVSLVGAAGLGIAAATRAILTKYEDAPWSSIPKHSPSSPRGTSRSSKGSRSSGTTRPTRTSPTPRGARRRGSTS